MKKTKIKIIKKPLDLISLAIKVGFSVEASLNSFNEEVFYIKENNKKVEEFSFNPSQLEIIRINTFLNEQKEIKEKENKVEELYLALVNNLSPDQQEILNLK